MERLHPRTAAAIAVLSAIPAVPGLAGGSERLEHFETKIRPVLAERCYECHSTAGKRRAGLALDHREGLLEGGESGAVIVPGNPGASLLVAALAHADGAPQMPKAGPKVSDDTLADFRTWIAQGAFDPRDEPPSAEDLAAETSWEEVRERREAWWSFQPVRPADPPAGEGGAIDRYLDRALAEAGVEPLGEAGRGALLRRASFVLTGLPPAPEEVEAFAADPGEGAFARLVDRLLASPRFGERWARHWMDWVRYAESHGSEGDPRIPHAYQYRDYLIRALNADVPYDQLVREHLAGDLLERPRINEELGVNESAIGPAHFRFVFHGFAPTDALDEQVRFTDNQIDVVTKTFLGLTVSCARCHNHKFDAISQADFYALYGIFASCKPALVNIDSPGALAPGVDEMRALKADIRKRVAGAWRRGGADGFAMRLLDPDEAMRKAIEAAGSPTDPLHAWRVLRDKSGAEFVEARDALARRYAESETRLASREAKHHFRLGDPDDYSKWSRHGAAPASGGGITVAGSGDRLIGQVLPSGAYSHLLSRKHNAVFESPKMLLDGHYRIYARVAGGDEAMLRYVVQNYPRNGTVFPVARIGGDGWRWQSWDLKYWEGDRIHLEAATAGDSPILASGKEQSWIGLRDVLLVADGDPAPQDEMAEHHAFWEGEGLAASPAELAANYALGLRGAVARWGAAAGPGSDRDALLLGHLLEAGLLPNTAAELPDVAALVERYRQLEAAIPLPTRAPGVSEGTPRDQPLFDRGDHKRPGDPVPRRFLEAFGGREYPDGSSGRRELAEDLVSNNPLSGRVMVNRLWHHVFGTGIVATTDNFGQLGEKPSHPELLDYLAVEFADGGYSIKAMLRRLVTSEAFRRTAGRVDGDPGNRLLAAYPVRRLEAEAIRDAMLRAAGRLDERMYGASVGGEGNRRSVYVSVVRNRLDPFLRAFDAPEPLSTRGRRDVTNVPGQSLELMNSAFVDSIAGDLAKAADGEPGQRVAEMFLRALGRAPSAVERERCVEFVNAADATSERARRALATAESKLDAARGQLAAIERPVLERLLAEKRGAAESGEAVDLDPVSAWEFDGDFRDSVGGAHGQPVGGVRLEGGGLVLEGGFVRTAALGRPMNAKTLEVWVQPADLRQKGGGVFTVQSPDGVLFDAIVFAERRPSEWMAGSNNFARTEDFRGAAKEAETSRPVHLAFVYGADGTIGAYRDGVPYGEPYRKAAGHRFAADSVVLFGLRHGRAAGGGRMFSGRIDRARLYDRALTAEEIAASARGDAFVSPAELDAALTEGARAERDRLATQVAEGEAAVVALRDAARGGDPWKELAHSILNLKEFIYLR